MGGAKSTILLRGKCYLCHHVRMTSVHRRGRKAHPKRVSKIGKMRNWLIATYLAAFVALISQCVAGVGNVAKDEGKKIILPHRSTKPTISSPTPDPAPFTVVATTDEDVCQTDWFSPRSPSFLRATLPKYRDNRIDWSMQPSMKDGAPISPSNVDLAIQGRTRDAVLITSLKINIKGRREAPTGTAVSSGCGGDLVPRWLEVNLDKDPPQVQHKELPADLGYSPKDRKPIKFPYTVSSSDVEYFRISTKTYDCDCLWTVELSWSSMGKTGTKEVDDHGKPFRTVSRRKAKECTWQGGLFCEKS